jgi:hypothetical protein
MLGSDVHDPAALGLGGTDGRRRGRRGPAADVRTRSGQRAPAEEKGGSLEAKTMPEATPRATRGLLSWSRGSGAPSKAEVQRTRSPAP